MGESHWRSIAKAFSWRITASSTTFIITYLITGKVKSAISVGIFDFVIKMALNYGHERMWIKITFGKKDYPVEYEI